MIGFLENQNAWPQGQQLDSSPRKIRSRRAWSRPADVLNSASKGLMNGSKVAVRAAGASQSVRRCSHPATSSFAILTAFRVRETESLRIWISDYSFGATFSRGAPSALA